MEYNDSCIQVMDDQNRTQPGGKPYPLFNETDDQLPEEIGNYRILDALGQGGMSRVYRAVKKGGPSREVALKVPLGGRLATRKMRERFKREVELAASLCADGVVPVLDEGQTTDGFPFYTMPLIKGWPLDEYLLRLRWNRP